MTTLLERAQREGTPLIDGSKATFVWKASGDIPHLVGDFTGWGAQPIELAEVEPGVWAHTLTLPPDAYVEYAYHRRYDIIESFTDPFNPRMAYNGMDSFNHYFTMPKYQPNPWIERKPGVKRGAITEAWLETDLFTGDTHRKVYLYQPPVDAPTPLLAVWDGGDYLRRGRLNLIVDNLIGQGRIRPISMLMIENGDSARYLEYMQSEATVAFLLDLLLPFAAKHLNLIDAAQQPGIHGVLGSSMGGLMALYTGMRAAETFGHVASQSGAFWLGGRKDMVVVDLIKHRPAEPLKIWQDVGLLERLLEGNRALHALLTEKGYDLTYREFSGGHNHTLWADNTWRALEALYGK